MYSFTVNIADFKIRFEKSPDGPDLIPEERFIPFLNNESDCDIRISVHRGAPEIPENTEKVFEAPYIEEVNGIVTRKLERFWSIHRNENSLFIQTLFPLSENIRTGMLKFSLDSREWKLWLDTEEKYANPMEYPLDGLILYYLTAMTGAIMIHASGVSIGGRGLLFSGISGKGKSTLARLWESAGAEVIHDDRLIIRKKEAGYQMHNTPVYRNDSPRSSSVNAIFIIEHGKNNELLPISGAISVSSVMANCIQQNWSPELVDRLLSSVSELSRDVKIGLLSFRPDESVVDYLLDNE